MKDFYKDINQKCLQDLKLQIDQVPQSPGVYLWKDEEGKVIYVGKAKALRSRMRQYVNFADDREKIPMLVSKIRSFDYVVVSNENEALILEKNLIDQYKPFFNVDFKDDKSYPLIAITMCDLFPAIKYTREKRKSGIRYFGPYTNGKTARKMIDILRKVCPICSANCNTWKKMSKTCPSLKTCEEKFEYFYQSLELNKPCFDYSVGLGPGACCAKVSLDDYNKNVNLAMNFLSGNHKDVLASLYRDMKKAASQLDFERAERLKKRIEAVEELNSSQHINIKSLVNMDIFGFYREETIACVQVLIVRQGKIINSNDFVLDKGKDIEEAQLQHDFFLKYYSLCDNVGKEIVVRKNFEIDDSLSNWLSKKLASSHGAKVEIVEPKRGEKLDLLKMAEVNAKHALLRHKVKSGYEDDRRNEALLQLESALALNKAPMRIECYDISTNHGSYTVASMVVFVAGKADKSKYRRFRIKAELSESNDFLCMQEVLRRRFSDKNINDETFATQPDLIILDGGKPQLRAASEIIAQLGIEDVQLAGLAKRDEELFVRWQTSGPVVLPSGSSSLYLIKNIRDEAHRFAITYHRSLIKKGQSRSILDEVEGLGPKRKKALLNYFGGFKNLRSTSQKELIDCGVIPKKVAIETYLVLQQYSQCL